MDLKLLNALMLVAGEAPVTDREVNLPGADPIFPLELPVGEAGAASIAATGVAASKLWQLRTGRTQHVRVDVDAGAAAMRGDRYMVREIPSKDTTPSPTAIRGDLGDIYRVGDGRWVYLHRGFKHHRDRIANLLGGANDAPSIEKSVLDWKGLDLEDAVHAAGACGGMIRSYEEWRAHPQSIALAQLPVFEIEKVGDSPVEGFAADGERPLSGIRVLDLTRVLAGPTCARTLAEHGAEVLRISTDLLPSNEAQVIATGHGKRSSVIDLTDEAGRETLRTLTRRADVFSQGYRPGAMAAKGFGVEDVVAMRPGMIYVTLNAFSRVGPWQNRRGFDTLVQSVSGICDDYRTADGRPHHLPVSALDYLAGYLEAFGVMVALARRAREGGSYHVRISLAQAAHWLINLNRIKPAKAAQAAKELPPERIAQLMQTTDTPFGPIKHLAPIVQLSETPPRWDLPSVPIDHHEPVWVS